MTYLFPRLLGRPWWSRSLQEWHYWLSATRMLVMFVDLVFAGIFQGFYWASLQPWEDSIRVSIPFWAVRLVAGLVIIAGQLCFGYNLYRTFRAGRSDV
jgi:cbb3-type cytochrome oxidase subunit 1